MTPDQDHANVLRRIMGALYGHESRFDDERAAIERAVEVLEWEAAPVHEGSQIRPEEISERNRRRSGR